MEYGTDDIQNLTFNIQNSATFILYPVPLYHVSCFCILHGQYMEFRTE